MLRHRIKKNCRKAAYLNMHFIMSLAQRIIVLNAGTQFREGTPAEIQEDAEVQKIYLGEGDDLACLK
uniref:Branched-chain amino acid ATP-binding cassette transporter C-terminal domain-containing protein n=1 Tax=Desulfatirhabdium butyrativorans TaxID=340467 RepID=A0A7C4MNT9_9BACT